MKVLQIYIENSLDNFNYIIYSERAQKAIHFDPFDIGQTLPLLEGKKVNSHFLVNTHRHGDHTRDNLKLIETTGAEKLTLASGERFYLSPEEFIEAMDTPGHTMDHQCFLLYEQGKLFGMITGDILFNCGVGNCKNGGDVETLFETVSKVIKRLPGDLKIYPGHDYMLKNLEFAQKIEPQNGRIQEYLEKYKRGDILTLDEEKKINPFLRTETSSMANNFPSMGEKQIFLNLRSLRDNF